MLIYSKSTVNMAVSTAATDAIIRQLVFLIPCLVTFVVYVSTTSNSIAGGDAGELVAEGCALGTAHPPGYPLYTLIVALVVRVMRNSSSWWDGSLFGYDDVRSPVYWVNVTSCLFGSISSGFLSSIVFRLSRDFGDESVKEASTASNQNLLRHVLSLSTMFGKLLCAISTSLLCSFSPLMWQYNKEAEVFALHILFVSAILYVLVIYEETVVSTKSKETTNAEHNWKTIAAGAFLCGLSLTNQHTSILLIFPVATYVCYQSSILRKPKLFITSTLSFLAGLSVYISLPLLAILRPHAGSWGDITSLSGFIHHLLRRDYGTLRLFSGDDSLSEGMLVRGRKWAYDFAICQISHPWARGFLLLGLLGQSIDLPTNRNQAIQAKRKAKNTKMAKQIKTHCRELKITNNAGKVIAFALVFYLGIFHSLSNLPLSNPLLFGIHQRFWMHSNILAFILLGVGMNNLVTATSRISVPLSLVLSVATLLLPLSQYRQNYVLSDQRSNSYFRSYAMSILETLPHNSLLLINYDQQWTSVRYLQECEGVRSDIRSINLRKTKQPLYPDVAFPGTHYTKGNTLSWVNGGFTFSELVDANMNKFDRKIFIGGKINYDDIAFTNKYEEIPHGLVRKIVPRLNETYHPAETYRLDSTRDWIVVSGHLSRNLPSYEKYPSSTWEWTISREFFEHMVSRSTYLLDLALKNNGHSQLVLPSIVEAAGWLELASSWDTEGEYKTSPPMKKNLGLAYMNMVRSKETVKFPFVTDIFDVDDRHYHNWWRQNLMTTQVEYDESWKAWATSRWKEEWELFLKLDSSKTEQGYDQVKSMYDAVMGSTGTTAR
ncbi:hypothetical protein HJC23_009778 [Cyclotella cryptica]|uniref:Uncharacterized protein n=1 Tax=Cyclotella cryptica TaxID=29204 RepID=A0ABD3PRP0_9STRA